MVLTKRASSAVLIIVSATALVIADLVTVYITTFPALPIVIAGPPQRTVAPIALPIAYIMTAQNVEATFDRTITNTLVVLTPHRTSVAPVGASATEWMGMADNTATRMSADVVVIRDVGAPITADQHDSAIGKALRGVSMIHRQKRPLRQLISTWRDLSEIFPSQEARTAHLQYNTCNIVRLEAILL